MAGFLSRLFGRSRQAVPVPPADPTGSPPSPPPPGGGFSPGGEDRTPSAGADGLGLDDVTRGLQHAAASANDLLAQQYLRMLDQFFDWDEEQKVMRAKTVLLDMDNGHEMRVPLVALSTPKGLYMEKMVVHLTVRHDASKAVEVHNEYIEASKRSVNFSVSMAPRKRDQGQRDTDTMDMELHFSSLPPPEALMRIIDEFANQVLPIKQQEPGSTPFE